MGQTLPEICSALCNTVPRHGILFTAEQEQVVQIADAAQTQGSEFVPVQASGNEPLFDFPENIALALAVCQYLGVDRHTALDGMCRYKRDPYALTMYRIRGCVWINGLSINDIQSTCMVWRQWSKRYALHQRKLILLDNNRADRGSRTQDMLHVCLELQPQEVWLLGAVRSYMKRGLARHLPTAKVTWFSSAGALDFSHLNEHCAVFAVGNIAGEGRALMDRVTKEGVPFV